VQEPKHLPCLETDDGNQFFMTDAATKYLMHGIEEDTSERSQWLEWSTSRLAPALAQFLTTGHRVDPHVTETLNSLVKHLDDSLAKSAFLTGDKITSADLAIWCLLTPDGTLKGSRDIENVMRWYKAIEQLQEVKDSLAVYGPVKKIHFASLLQCNRFGGLHHVEMKPHIAEIDTKVLADTPTSMTETVLPNEIEEAKQNFVPVKVEKKEEPKTVFPKPNERNVLITSALPYVNNVPHLGNIIGCVLSADIFARYSRMCGNNTLFVCGTDEYGTATETKAIAENMTCQEVCDKYFEMHNSIYRWFGIGFDYFGRTSTPEQTEITQEIFWELHRKDLIETDAVEQLLCLKCDRFLADRFVEGTCPHPGCNYEDARGDQCDACGKLINAIDLIRPRCKLCSTAPVVRESNHLFLNLPKLEPELRKHLEAVDSQWTHNARTITKSWLKEGLRSRCITRDLKWGVPVPLKGFESKVFYVWFDACIGYMSITNKYTKEWRRWWQPDPSTKVELCHFMAKDNVPFHSVIFPSTLIGVDKGYTLVSRINATEYLNYEDGKFSKSRGIGVFGNDAQDTGIESDIWRFYLASARPEGQDSTFSWSDLATRNNSELLNNLGNFINRALVFCEKNFNSTISNITLNNDDAILVAIVNREIKGYVNSMERARYRDGIRHILAVSRQGNLYMQNEKPWVLQKGTDEQKTRAHSVISLCCNITSLLANLLFPFMPTTSRKIFAQLNISGASINPS
jgi:methionyl-tRNA synthetase